MITDVAEGVAELFGVHKDTILKHRESMRRQGLVGWVLFHPATGIVLRLYQSVTSAESSVTALSSRHGVCFRVLAVSANGSAYEHAGGKAVRAALDPKGRAIHIPLNGRRINRRYVRHYVADTIRVKAAG